MHKAISAVKSVKYWVLSDVRLEFMKESVRKISVSSAHYHSDERSDPKSTKMTVNIDQSTTNWTNYRLVVHYALSDDKNQVFGSPYSHIIFYIYYTRIHGSVR